MERLPARLRARRRYLAAAAIVMVALGAGLAWWLSSGSGAPAQSAACRQVLACQAGPGFRAKVQAEIAVDHVLGARSPAEAQAGYRTLISAVAAGLRHPPPGPARSSYLTALNDFRAAGTDLRANRVEAAVEVTQAGITADERATATVTRQAKQCQPS